MDAVRDVGFDGDGSFTKYDVFSVNYVFLNSEGYVTVRPVWLMKITSGSI